jgi:outer membrane protein OmpA-like peptidoglycan-associated protein
MRWALLLSLLAAPAFAQDDEEEPAPAEEATEVSEVSEEAPDKPATTGFPSVHLAGLAGVDFMAMQFGLELGVTYSPHRLFDVGLGASFGSSIGLLILAEVHMPWRDDSLFRAFGQVRGAFHFQSGGYGGGVWAGASVEAGPGRVKLGPALEFFGARDGYHPFAIMALAGYEVDLVRPARSEVVTERVVERVVEKPRVTPTVLHGRLLNLDDRPINGTVRIKGKSYEAAPEFETELEPGEYLVEAEAPNYLVRGRRVLLKKGQTTNADFILRPVPKVATAELTTSEVKIKQQIQFEFSKAAILKESDFILDEVADVLIRNPQLKAIRIEGHTDDVGGKDANQVLSEDRALAVQKALIERGVEPERLQAQGFGLARPLASNKTEAGRAKNRRVQFRIVE